MEATDKALVKLRHQVLDLHKTLGNLHMEAPSLSWPTFTDRYSVILVKLDCILKHLQGGTPLLNEMILVPKDLSTFPNQQLQHATRGHIASFAHDVVPALLRTKLMPEIEQAQFDLSRRIDASASEISDVALSATIEKINDMLAFIVREIDETTKGLKQPNSSKFGAAEGNDKKYNSSLPAFSAALESGAGLK
eukprot:m.11027 g.11027  ORF g.11027 m.11027 type:complete len:193 (+) comp8166_c0_seq1:222-800(+)